MILEKTLESPLDCKEIQPVRSKGDQSWVFIGRTDAEAETPYFGHLIWRTDSLEKTLVLGKNEGRKRRGRQRMRWLDGWYHRLDGHEFEQAPGVGDGQGNLACCSPWGHKELDTTEWTELRGLLSSGNWELYLVAHCQGEEWLMNAELSFTWEAL